MEVEVALEPFLVFVLFGVGGWVGGWVGRKRFE